MLTTGLRRLALAQGLLDPQTERAAPPWSGADRPADTRRPDPAAPQSPARPWTWREMSRTERS